MLFLGSVIATLNNRGVGHALSDTCRLLLLVGLLVGYAFFGAGLFFLVEKPDQVVRENVAKLDAEKKLDDAARALTDAVFAHCKALSNKSSSDGPKSMDPKCLAAVKEEIYHAFPETRGKIYGWSYWEALIYAATIFTTIGYGHLHCNTEVGRAFTILYAVVGIPLTMTVLNNIGKLLYRGLRLFYKGTTNMIFKTWNSIWKKAEQLDHRLSRISSFVEVDESQSPRNIPVCLAVTIMVLYILLSAGVFQYWERDWDYFTAVYFMFVSLSTIGFGDVIPRNPNHMLSACVLILIGLALVSMCISVLQAKLEQSYQEVYSTVEKKIENLKSVPNYGSTEEQESSLGPPSEKVHKPESDKKDQKIDRHIGIGIFKSMDQRDDPRQQEKDQQRRDKRNSANEDEGNKNSLEPTTPTKVKWRNNSTGDKTKPKNKN